MSDTKTQTQPSWRDWLPVHPANKIFPPLAPEKLEAIGRAMLAKQARGEKPIPERIVLFYDGERPGLAVINKPDWWRQKTHLAKLSVGDGCSRLDAAEKYLGINWFEECATFIRIEYLRGEGAVEPWSFSFDANFRRRQLKPRDRRDVVAAYRKARPDLSDNAIAKELDVSPTTVASVTKALEATGDVSKMETRVDSKGRKQRTRKPRKTKPEDEEERVGARLAESDSIVLESANSETSEPAPAATLKPEKLELRRRERFLRLCTTIQAACSVAPEVEIPHLESEEMERWKEDLNEAANNLHQLERNLQSSTSVPAAEPPVQLQLEPAVTAAASTYSLEDRRRNFIGALVGLTSEDLEWARKEFDDWLEENTRRVRLHERRSTKGGLSRGQCGGAAVPARIAGALAPRWPPARGRMGGAQSEARRSASRQLQDQCAHRPVGRFCDGRSRR